MKNLATLGFVGYLPLAPGTFGTAVALLLIALLQPSFPIHLVLLLVSIIVGTVAAGAAETLLNEKDSSHIVIDEFAGYILSVLALPLTAPYLVAAFLLFRLFDILKPPPIQWIERVLPGGGGIVADDLMAAIYANAVLQIWKVLG